MIARLMASPPASGSLLLVLTLIFAANARGAACFDLIPKDAKPDGEPWLCESAHSGELQAYGCQDYLSGQKHYRLYFRGGAAPKAIAIVERDEPRVFHQSTRVNASQVQTCEIAVPVGVPDAATHLGTGVCKDGCGKPVPCSVFRLEAARELAIIHYTVLYHPQGHGPLSMDTRVMGNNEEALAAELSYQLGVSLLHADCCPEQALGYLAHAHRLFPDDKQYRESYLRMRAMRSASTR